MKKRLDVFIAEKKLVRSRKMAQDLIAEGKILVNGKRATKSSITVSATASIKIESYPRYVSRGGLKLEHALKSFAVNVKDLVIADVGSSRGGFTDCVLQHGAKKVYAIDVGKNQLDNKLRYDPRVQVHEETDIRELKSLPELINFAVVDVSFISLTQVLPSVQKLLKPDGEIIALIKPEFELGAAARDKRGVVRGENNLQKAIEKIKSWARGNNWKIKGLIESPVKGAQGNIEYLIYLIPG